MQGSLVQVALTGNTSKVGLSPWNFSFMTPALWTLVAFPCPSSGLSVKKKNGLETFYMWLLVTQTLLTDVH